MIRKEAIEIAAKEIGKFPIISANGYISRDLFESNEKNSNFYMIGSMGLASSIGLGVALKNSKKRVYVFDGDGNILMNLGSLVTIGASGPSNLIHFVFDNRSHESTGGQPTCTNVIKIDEIAKSVNYKVFKANTKNELLKVLKKIKHKQGPLMILVKIRKSTIENAKQISLHENKNKRITIPPKEIKDRFITSLMK